MNNAGVALSAIVLEARFKEVEDSSPQMAALFGDMKLYIEIAKRGEIDTPIEKSSVPGGYLFNDGELRPYPDLERAYVHFRVQISGGLSKKQEKILEQIGKI